MADDLSPFELLLKVQEADIHHDQLRHQIENHPRQTEIVALHDRSVAIDHATKASRDERDGYVTRQTGIEEEIRDIDRRVSEIDARLSSDTSGSFRDQTAMSNEMNALVGRKRALEDEELELMELIEPLDTLLKDAHLRQQLLQNQARVHLDAMAKERRVLKLELDDVLVQREALAAALPASLLTEYTKLRERLGGIGAARLVHGMCSGCNLALSATEVDRLRHADATKLVHCDQCGRILVP